MPCHSLNVQPRCNCRLINRMEIPVSSLTFSSHGNTYDVYGYNTRWGSATKRVGLAEALYLASP
ncbi:hypothetical protein SAMN02927900_05653 [Rhizobium mongolense subsp. loessense]|uniref:Uncharacterized protein n=1 Tax=Rhizobium mongolense subsp. loessense TaxID=158890 RepID=A0A1G4TUH3_9HYPH|nr:hypothetical protein SAMN02927900_05653 [Rhizobium mongolense subsp. loessense]